MNAPHLLSIASVAEPIDKPQWGPDFSVTYAILAYLAVNMVTPAFRRLLTKEDTESRRVNEFIAFQQGQLKELIGAIDRQTSVVAEQSKTVGKLTIAVDHLIRRQQRS